MKWLHVRNAPADGESLLPALQEEQQAHGWMQHPLAQQGWGAGAAASALLGDRQG